MENMPFSACQHNLVAAPGKEELIFYVQGGYGKMEARQSVHLQVVGSVSGPRICPESVEVARHRTVCGPRFQAPSACSIVLLDFAYKTQNRRHNSLEFHDSNCTALNPK